jgi:hypothetical protein
MENLERIDSIADFVVRRELLNAPEEAREKGLI